MFRTGLFGLSLLTVFYTKRMIVLTIGNIARVKVLTHNSFLHVIASYIEFTFMQ